MATKALNLNGWAMNSTVRRCGQEVDSSIHGNKNGQIDTQAERDYFTKLIKTAFNYDFDFNKNIEKQDLELSKYFEKAPTEGMRLLDVNRDTFNNLYSFTGEDAGKDAGFNALLDLSGYTNKGEINRLKRNIKMMEEDYTPELNNRITKNFLTKYYESKEISDSGFFEQIGNENGSSKITNAEACILLKRIMEAAPQDKKESDDFKTIENAYNEYSNLDEEGLFKDKSGKWARMFGAGYLDNLDDAIEDLFNL